jgi:hypothetical protein
MPSTVVHDRLVWGINIFLSSNVTNELVFSISRIWSWIYLSCITGWLLFVNCDQSSCHKQVTPNFCFSNWILYRLSLFVSFKLISVRLRAERELSAVKWNASIQIKCHHKTAEKRNDHCFDRPAMFGQIVTKVSAICLKLVSVFGILLSARQFRSIYNNLNLFIFVLFCSSF